MREEPRDKEETWALAWRGSQDNDGIREKTGHRTTESCKSSISARSVPGGDTSHLLSACGKAAQAKDLFIRELNGYSSNPLMEAALTSLSLSFLNCQMNSIEFKGAAKPVSVQLDPHTGVRGHWTLAGEGRGDECFNYSCSRSLPLSGPLRKCKFSKKEKGYKITVSRFGWGDDKRFAICTFGFSTCSVLSYLCDLCQWKQIYGWVPV